MRVKLVTALVAILFMAALGGAAESAQRIPWQSLNSGERELLGRYADRWDSLPYERQERLLRSAERYSRMSPQERMDAKERSRRVKELPPERKERLQKKADQFQKLPPQEQEQVRERYKWYRDLPPEKRKMLREKWKSMTPDQRRILKNERSGGRYEDVR